MRDILRCLRRWQKMFDLDWRAIFALELIINTHILMRNIDPARVSRLLLIAAFGLYGWDISRIDGPPSPQRISAAAKEDDQNDNCHKASPCI